MQTIRDKAIIKKQERFWYLITRRLYMKQHYTLGIDIGSTTVKIAILDAEHNILFSDYPQ